MLRVPPRPILILVAGLLMAGGFTPAAVALEAREEPLPVAGERFSAQDEPVGESGGEPSAEDAPVEGEPGPGDAVSVPPDEAPAADAATAPDGGTVDPKPKD
ncbi:MAG: hypothetical protein ACM3L9_04270 [Deltaproteobacteria bacterium]